MSPTAAPTVVDTVVDPSRVPRDAEPTWTPDPELVRTTPTLAAPPTPRPTLDISSIPSLEHPVGSQPIAGGAAERRTLRLDEADFEYPAYMEKIVQTLGANWFKPARSMQRSPVVHFQIERDGTITQPRIVTSSGLGFVDRAAMRAVIVSSPLPPLPAEYAGPHLGLQVAFE